VLAPPLPKKRKIIDYKKLKSMRLGVVSNGITFEQKKQKLVNLFQHSKVTYIQHGDLGSLHFPLSERKEI
jgi:hypothetical protein